MKYFNGKKEIQRPKDLAPLGVKSTIKGEYEINEVMKHIYTEARKPDEAWKKLKLKGQ